MKKSDIFPVILLIARPAAGKSEIIQYLSDLDEKERKNTFHIGQMRVIDDFPFLWRWFEEDKILENMGKEHLYTDENGNFLQEYLWNLLIKMIALEYDKGLRDSAGLENTTTIIEFSRGKQHGGYRQALPQLSPQILKELSILYVDVPWEESLRKNRKRFNPDKPDSILEHSLPDKKLEYLYKECDFMELTSGSPEMLEVNEHEVPYVVFDNKDDVTTSMGPELGRRLKTCLEQLWLLRQSHLSA